MGRETQIRVLECDRPEISYYYTCIYHFELLALVKSEELDMEPPGSVKLTFHVKISMLTKTGM